MMVGHMFGGEEQRMQDGIARAMEIEERKALQRMTDGYNILRGALVWFDSHDVEKKLDHLPQWVAMGRELTGNK